MISIPESVICFCQVSQVVDLIKHLWPTTVMVTGLPRHSESNGGIERLNRCVNAAVCAWLQQHCSGAEGEHQRWALALPFVQMQLNMRFHRGIQAVPYEVTFGQKPQAR